MKILINGFMTLREQRKQIDGVTSANRWSDECSSEILPVYLHGKAADIYIYKTTRVC